MKVKEISYRRVRNLGNYETETLEVVADVLEGQSLEEAFVELSEQVTGLLFADKEGV